MTVFWSPLSAEITMQKGRNERSRRWEDASINAERIVLQIRAFFRVARAVLPLLSWSVSILTAIDSARIHGNVHRFLLSAFLVRRPHRWTWIACVFRQSYGISFLARHSESKWSAEYSIRSIMLTFCVEETTSSTSWRDDLGRDACSREIQFFLSVFSHDYTFSTCNFF